MSRHPDELERRLAKLKNASKLTLFSRLRDIRSWLGIIQSKIGVLEVELSGYKRAESIDKQELIEIKKLLRMPNNEDSSSF